MLKEDLGSGDWLVEMLKAWSPTWGGVQSLPTLWVSSCPFCAPQHPLTSVRKYWAS